MTPDTRLVPDGPYRAEFGAIHHEDQAGFLFTVTPTAFADDVAHALNVNAMLAAAPALPAAEAGDTHTLRVLLDNLVIAQSLSREMRQQATDQARAYLYSLRHPHPQVKTVHGTSQETHAEDVSENRKDVSGNAGEDAFGDALVALLYRHGLKVALDVSEIEALRLIATDSSALLPAVRAYLDALDVQYANSSVADGESGRLNRLIAASNKALDDLRAVTSFEDCDALRARSSEPVAPPAIRPVVLAFAHLMEAKLRENEWKGGWQKCSPESLLARVREETDELAEAIGPGSRTDVGLWRPLVANEAADVANMAMMVADVCGGLDAEACKSIADSYTHPAPDASALREALQGLANALEIAPGPRGVMDLVPAALAKARAALDGEG